MTQTVDIGRGQTLRGDTPQKYPVAVRRRMRDNLGAPNPHNVVDYGADPTGAADSYDAAVAAITAAGEGGSVFFPDGTFSLSSYLEPLARQRIMGAGARQTYLTSTDATPSAGIFRPDVADVIIERMGFLGQQGKTGINSDIIIEPAGAARLTIQDCYCDQHVQRFLLAREASVDIVVRRCHLSGTKYSNTIEINASNNPDLSDIIINAVSATGTGTGIELFAHGDTLGLTNDRFSIRNCQFEYIGGNGINIQGARHGEIRGNRFREIGRIGIYLMGDENVSTRYPGTGLLVIDNTLVDCGTDQTGQAGAMIQVSNLLGGRIADNQLLCYDTTKVRYAHRIYVGDSTGVVIENNYLWTDPLCWRNGAIAYNTNGIALHTSTAVDCVVRGNTIANQSSGTQANGFTPICHGIIPGPGCVVENNLIYDDRAAALPADSTARLALSSGKRVGMTVVQLDDFSRWKLMPHDQYITGLRADVAGHWCQLKSLPYHSCASEAAMLAVPNAAVGDVCVRSDVSGAGKVKILTATPATTLGNWATLSTSNAHLGGINTRNLEFGIQIVDSPNGVWIANNRIENYYSVSLYDPSSYTRFSQFKRNIIFNFGSAGALAAGATRYIEATLEEAVIRKPQQVVVGVPNDWPPGIQIQGIIQGTGPSSTVRFHITNATSGSLTPTNGNATFTVTIGH